jgi:hypothetical protein
MEKSSTCELTTRGEYLCDKRVFMSRYLMSLETLAIDGKCHIRKGLRVQELIEDC